MYGSAYISFPFDLLRGLLLCGGWLFVLHYTVQPVIKFRIFPDGDLPYPAVCADYDRYMLSVFHDENSNWELDMDEQKRPLEGVAQSYYQFEPGKTGCKMTLYYLPNPE